MRFVTRSEVGWRFKGKRVVIVGSGPGCLDNEAGFIDSHEVVVRVNNYLLVPPATGQRTDCFYSFFGSSIRKTADELRRDGVTLCMAKCPNAAAIDSEWHRVNGKVHGVDFRWIYELRKKFWFCDTYIPDKDEFLAIFNMLGGHVATTGFSAIVDVISLEPKSIYLTGFDFFKSGIHNVNEPWRKKRNNDPIGHVPDLEFEWLRKAMEIAPISVDRKLGLLLGEC